MKRIKSWFVEEFGFTWIFTGIGLIASGLYYYLVQNPNWKGFVAPVVGLYFYGSQKEFTRQMVLKEKRITQLEEALRNNNIPLP